MNEPWEDPDWYDLHDTTHTAGPEREPEHYRECVIALPPLGAADHLVDVGAGTGKLSRLIAQAYSTIGQVTLLEPNAAKLERATRRLREALSGSRVEALQTSLGEELAPVLSRPATIVMVGSVVMPTLMLRGGALTNGLTWVHRFLSQCVAMLAPGGSIFLLETLAPPWALAESGGNCRRLFLPELERELGRAGFVGVECVYRFRDRVVVTATRA